jgi:uncharacterized protein (TIGR02118 family)
MEARALIRVNVLYPTRDGARFDFDYYLQRHIPMVKDLLQPFGLTEVNVDHGIAGLTPGSPAIYVCIGSLQFPSIDALQKGMEAHGAAILADVPQYTNIEPELQVSEVKV